VSRSSNNCVAIGLGARAVAVGVRASRYERLRALNLPRRIGMRVPDAAQPAEQLLPRANIAMADDQCFSEEGAFNVLRQALESEASSSNRRLNSTRRAFIVLDDFWANHAILCGDFRRVRAREVDEIARAHFSDNFGLDGDSLSVRSMVQRGGKALFSSAISRALQDGIHAVAASERVEVKSLTLGLPRTLNRLRVAVGGGAAMLLVMTQTHLHAVLIDRNCWVAYDTHRVFPADADDASRLAAIAERIFERASNSRREDCMVYLCGLDVDPTVFERRFAGAQHLPGPAMGVSPELHLMGLAQ
jgi:hypothetical protein